MLKTYLTLVIIILELNLFTNCTSKANKTDDSNYNYSIIIITKTQFGYQIFNNDKVYIRQKNIPAIAGNYAFKTKTDAKKVANLVIYKLQKGLLPPTITVVELDSLKINYPKF